MKKLLILILIYFSFASYAQTVNFAVISAEDVNYRKSPDTKGEIITRLKLGTLAIILEGPVNKANLIWYKLQIGNQIGWVVSDFAFELSPLSKYSLNTLSVKGFTPYLAYSLDKEQKGFRQNFIVMLEGDKLSANSKLYPVKISVATAKSKASNFYFYRENYLSLGQLIQESKVLVFKQTASAKSILSFETGNVSSALFVYELLPKISEGVFEADIKYFYSE